MKLTVKERFYDKKESIYVEKDTVIEREDERAQELIEAGVAVSFEEEKLEEEKSEDEKTEDEKSEDEKSEDEEPEDEKPAKGKKKSKKTE